MGPVSGFVLQAEGEPSLYIAGDTIWCDEMAEALRTYQPAVTVVNTGAAQFNVGGPITMTAEEVVAVCRELPTTHVIAVHMEAVNHCLLARAELCQTLEIEGLSAQVIIPADGEVAFEQA
jgi:L-ascorbate metabolism protein UlaG (beta-lactamase superfamily)